ncbi:MAG TPA: hypothetical protein P5092_10040 [Ruminococcus sp.]|nr:hypothetical protein [Ruminococcus sp.]
MLRKYKAYCNETADRYVSKWNYEENAVFFTQKKYGTFLNPATARSWLNSFTESIVFSQ